MAVPSLTSRDNLSGLLVKGLIILLVIELGLALDQILHAHRRGWSGGRVICEKKKQNNDLDPAAKSELYQVGSEGGWE